MERKQLPRQGRRTGAPRASNTATDLMPDSKILIPLAHLNPNPEVGDVVEIVSASAEEGRTESIYEITAICKYTVEAELKRDA
jgi:hypothetical protein